MNYLILFGGLMAVLLALGYLVKQSKKPSGIVGIAMMKIWNRVYLPMVSWALSQLDRRSYRAILDVGVGNGRSSLYLKKSFPRAQVTGIDISPTAVQEAQKLAETGLSFAVKAVQATEFSAATFDLITAFQSHFHWSDLEGALAELRRVLKADGLILLACEWSKLAYYLPAYKNQEAFESFLKKLDLRLVSCQRENQWILYKIAKKEGDIC